MTSYLKKLGEKLEKTVESKVWGSGDGLRSDGSDDPFSVSLTNFTALGGFINTLISQVKVTASSVKESNKAYREFAGVINQQITGPLSQSFDIQQLTVSFCQYQTSLQVAAEKEYIANLQANFLQPLTKEKEVDNDIKRIVEERKKLQHEYDHARKNGGDVNGTKGRLDRYTEKATEHLIKKTEERSVHIARAIGALMKVQRLYHKLSLGVSPEFDAEIERNLSSMEGRNDSPAPTTHHQHQQNVSPQAPPKEVKPQPVSPPQVHQTQPEPHRSPPVAEINISVGSNNLIDDLDFGGLSSQPPMQSSSFAQPTSQPPVAQKAPSSSNLLFSLDDTPVSTPPPSNKSNTSSMFGGMEDSLFSLGPTNPAPPPQTQSAPSVFDGFEFPTTSSTPPTTSPSQAHKPVPTNFGSGGGVFSDLFSVNPAAKGSQPKPSVSSTPSTPANLQPSGSNSAPNVHSAWAADHEEDKKTTPAVRKPHVNIPKRDTLKDFQNNQKEAEAENQQRRDLDDEVSDRVEKWSAGKTNNIRALLSSLHQVLWEDHTWNPVSIGDLIQPNKLKITYRKAQLIVHSDKMVGKPMEQRLLAEKIFSVLQECAKTESALQ
eukprot:TRINITY_DN13744_c0_g1_i1.p1 TRINITY_DN13744_c0_g1~~TRINITY_DN13744_c0_g1_i1.p1  ORF type:complete len:601 (+),score=221.59 TRINITY_DN13744_c0_g1_i1:81-1883(+)